MYVNFLLKTTLMGEIGDLILFFLQFVVLYLSVGGWVVLGWCRKSYLGPAEIMYMCDGPIETIECI